MLVVNSLEGYFHDLLEQSSVRYKLIVPAEAKIYMTGLLAEMVIDSSRMTIADSLSIVFMTALEENNKTTLRAIGDTCLFTLGFFPTHKPYLNSLYYSLGPTSYERLPHSNAAYRYLSTNFVKAVDLLLGAHTLVNNDLDLLKAWQATRSRLLEQALREQNIVPMELYRD